MADRNGLLRTPADTCGRREASRRQLRGSGALLHSGLQTERHASGAGLKAQERRQDHIDTFCAGAVRTTRGFTPTTHPSAWQSSLPTNIGRRRFSRSQQWRHQVPSGAHELGRGSCAADSMITGRSPACTDGCTGRSGVLRQATGVPLRWTGVIMLEADKNQVLGMKRSQPKSPRWEEWIKQQLYKFPALTEERRDRIAAIVAGSRQHVMDRTDQFDQSA